ncbi:MAG: protein kinase [Pseudomonadota bacterium]
MSARLLVVAEDTQYGRWLRHRIEASREQSRVEAIDFEQFRQRRGSLTRRDCDLLLMTMHFAANSEGVSEGLEWLRRLRDQPGMPPVMAIAEDGDELTAVQSLRLGAADYLPRQLATPERLLVAVDRSLRSAPRETPRRIPAPREIAREEPAVVSAPLVRDLIPRYSLLQKLGESTRATVYLAASAALGRNVALKVTRNVDAEIGNFAHEYAAIGALSHPSVVDIYDYGVHDGREYIAMEYFPCGDLKARLQNPLTEEQSLDYLRRITGALSVVHQAGILHRDLKPPNIMLREDGQVVLIDFGLAKNLLAGTRSTAAGVLRGSPYYMSPEQAQGVDLDHRSDLYSLGVIFYEMLMGAKPYVGSTAMDVLQQHVAGPVPELPGDLAHHQELLLGLMAKAREERYGSAEELLQALDVAA